MLWGTKNQPFDLDTKTNSPTVVVDDGSTSVLGNHIYFYKQVDQNSAADINNKILSTKITLQKSAIDLGLTSELPIHLHIHSCGGSMFSGLAMADIIAANN
jgi:ATP-dependent protease ClpP protease subunit